MSDDRNRILKAISYSVKRLLSAEGLRAVPDVLQQLAHSVQACRACLVQEVVDAGEPAMIKRYESTAHGVEPWGDCNGFPTCKWQGSGMERWREILRQGGLISGLVTDLPASERRVLATRGVLWVLVVPIFVNDRFWGFIGFDQCSTERMVADAETEVLKIASSVIAAAIEREQADVQLKESELRFRQLANHIPEVFWIALPEEHRILYLSPAFEQVWGRSVESLYANPKSFLDSVHPEDRMRLRSARKESLAGSAMDIEYRIFRPDGHVRWIRDRWFPAPHNPGEVTRLAGIAEDITERKQIERARLTHETEQRDALVREVHHRIKNNLQGVIGLLRQHMRERANTTDALKTAILQIQSIAAVHGLQSHGEQGNVRLQELVRMVAQTCEYGQQPPTLSGSAEALEVLETEAVPIALIINELLTNACKHSLAVDQSCIRIDLSCSRVGAMLRIANPAFGLPDGFDFDAGKNLGTGLTLVRSLMPHVGARLSFQYQSAHVLVELHLEPPVVAFVVRHEKVSKP